ncbi:MAG: HAMP domain-containing protein [Desertifilum sp. SIO1I2]|nr:HAMP domain-containing protein [Desertifilum sp. SIO1I2]
MSLLPSRIAPKPAKPKKLGLRTTLVFPFVLQVVTITGLVGWLSFRSGQRAVNELATQLRQEIVVRVHEEVDRYLEAPQLLHQLNAQVFQQDLLNLEDPEALTRYFWQQSQLFNQFGTVAFANDRGEFFGANGLEDYVVIATQRDRTLRRYSANAQGEPETILSERSEYDARTRSWYKTALSVGQPTWTEIEPSTIGQRLDASAVYALYNRDRSLRGILLCDVSLSGIVTFLQSLRIGKTGSAFIVERNGLLVANSTPELPYIPGKGDRPPQRLNALNSANPTLRTALQKLLANFTNLDRIERSHQLEFWLEGERQFLQVEPFQDGYGIDWLILVIVPEADFMAQIYANTRNTVLLCLLALGGAIAMGILTARWITHPILRLTRASDEMARGNLNQSIYLPNLLQIIEIEKLTQSFNSMAEQLKTSFERVETQKNAFARFFPTEFLKFLQKPDVTRIELGDHVSKEMAIAFSDIRSFTTLSESMTPQENFNFVNAYLQRVSPEICKYNGFVVKFIGDAVMAVFPDRVDDAVDAGIAQFQQLQQLNSDRQTQGQSPIQIGMGIHVGYMMVGMVGEQNRIQGDAISDNVNLTARLEGLTKFYGASMVISEEVVKQLQRPEKYQIRFLDRAIVKGRSEPIGVYEVMDVEQVDLRVLKLKTLADFQQALQQYCQGNLTEARQGFEQVLRINPTDKAAQLYLERIDRLNQQGIPANWNGVWAFTQK